MENFCSRYYLLWPYIKKYEGTLTLDELEENFKNYTGYNITSSKDTHKIEREPNLWIFEPDGSLIDNNLKSAGIELVSPPMTISQAIDALHVFWDWIKVNNIITNSTCGFHI
jgi:hypothetical protein